MKELEKFTEKNFSFYNFRFIRSLDTIIFKKKKHDEDF